MKKAILSFFALGLLAMVAHATPVFDQWSGTGPFATGQGHRVISALAVSADGTVAYAGTGSGTVLHYAYSDTAPEAFSFTALTGVALSTEVTSNSITVTGINTGAAIGITGGTYAINGGAYTAGAGTVNAGDTVTVRLTSSANFSTTTTATLTIGTATGSFAVTTLPIDTVPNPFSFTAQTGVMLSAVATSDSITVAGINSAATILVTGGTYAVNDGTYTAVAGTVNNGDKVTVRQTASASYNTVTAVSLSIGGVSAIFNVTTVPPPQSSYTAPSGTGTGNITASFTGGGPACGFASSQFITMTSSPSGVTLPHGAFSFTTTQCDAGATMNFTITYPQPLPAGAKYYKFGPEFGGSATPHWYELPGAVVSGSQVTFSITDNGVGDSNPAPGYITDPGGVGVPASSVTSVPTLSEWALMLLAGLMGLAGVCVQRHAVMPHTPKTIADGAFK